MPIARAVHSSPVAAARVAVRAPRGAAAAAPLDTRGALLWSAAHHEAGHAVVAWYFGKTFHGGGVVVRHDLPGEGVCFTSAVLIPRLAGLPVATVARARAALRAECMEYLAGYLAEQRAEQRRTGRRVPVLWGDDARRAQLLVMRAEGCIAAVATLHLLRCARAVRRLLRRPPVWQAVEAVARVLLERGRLAPAEIEVLLGAQGMPRRGASHGARLDGSGRMRLAAA